MKKLMVVLAGVGILSLVSCDSNNGQSLSPADTVQRYVEFLQQGKLREVATLTAEPGRQVMLADADAFDAHRQLIEAAKKQYGPSSQSSFDSFAMNIGKGFQQSTTSHYCHCWWRQNFREITLTPIFTPQSRSTHRWWRHC